MEKDVVYVRARELPGVLGLSYEYIIKGCKEGTIPHVRVGKGKNARYMINLPMYLEQLDKESNNI